MLRLWVLREINWRFRSKTQRQMFLLVFGRHVVAHLAGHQHGGSIPISINLGRTFLRISSIRKIAVTWILARVFAYLPSLYFQILDLIYWTVFIFYFDLFWMAWHWKPAIAHIRNNHASGSIYGGLNILLNRDKNVFIFFSNGANPPFIDSYFSLIFTK